MTAPTKPLPAIRGFHWRTRAGATALVPDFFDALDLAGGFTTRVGPGGRDIDFDLRGGKERAAILENRRLACDAMDVDACRLVIGEQVHGARIAEVGGIDAGSGAISPERTIPGVDGLVTTERSVPIAVMSADCVLVLLADDARRAVTAVHSGWPGTAGEIVPAAVAALSQMGVEPASLYAAIGPSIGACCYEVGEELRERFARFTWGPQVFTICGGKSHLDLPGAVRRQLLGAGVRASRIAEAGLCTYCRAGLFHSYRRDGRAAGRTAGVITLQ